MALLILCYVIVVGFIGALLWNVYSLRQARNSIRYRIHINGARGKDPTTYFVSAVLRDAGVVTYGKTVGPKGRVILPDGTEAAAEYNLDLTDVNEQIDALRSFASRKAGAVVMECATALPEYQDWLEHRIMRSHIAIITHVYVDKTGADRERALAAAHRLATWIPRKAYVITAERQPELLAILEEACKRKQSQLIPVSGDSVKLASIENFGLMLHRDEVAIGLAVAQLLSIPAPQAVASMAGADLSYEVRRLERATIDGKQVVWANFFGVDDGQSFEQMAKLLVKEFPGYARIAVVGNRKNQLKQVAKLSKLAVEGLRVQAIVALGDHEEELSASVKRDTIPVLKLGNASVYGHVSGDIMLDQILRLTKQSKVLLIGIGSDRANQSSQIMRYIARMAETATREEGAHV